MQGRFNDMFNDTGVQIKIKSDKKLCQTQTHNMTLTAGSKAAMWEDSVWIDFLVILSVLYRLCFVALFAVIFFSTLYDAMTMEVGEKSMWMKKKL